MSIWTNFVFRIIITWVNLIASVCILAFHTYRICYLHRGLEGSPIKILKVISFQHLSFVVIIAGMLPLIFQAIMYTPQIAIPDSICRFSAQFGIVCLAVLKLALHLFVAVRSQVARGTTNIWYTIGLCLISSDILYIIYALSGIPTIHSVQYGALCKVVDISLPIYIWFGMNDFVIGTYCLLAFILPLRKYVWLEEEQDPAGIPADTNDAQLRDITKRVMIYSAIALVSTMIFTVLSSVVNESGAVWYPVDSTFNALCVVLQFKNRLDKRCPCFPSAEPLKSMSSISEIDTRTNVTIAGRKPKVSMVLHSEYPTKKKPMPKKVNLKNNVSLSLSLVKDAAVVPDL